MHHAHTVCVPRARACATSYQGTAYLLSLATWLQVHVYQKTIKTLLAKLDAMDGSKRLELQRQQGDDDEREREKVVGQQAVEVMEGEASEGRRLLSHTEDELARTQSAHAELQGKHAQLLSLQDDAVKFTLQCLQDMAEELAVPPAPLEATEHGRPPLSLQTLDPTQREQVGPPVCLLNQQRPACCPCTSACSPIPLPAAPAPLPARPGAALPARPAAGLPAAAARGAAAEPVATHRLA